MNHATVRCEILMVETPEELSSVNNWTGINRELNLTASMLTFYCISTALFLTVLLAKWLERDVTPLLVLQRQVSEERLD